MFVCLCRVCSSSSTRQKCCKWRHLEIKLCIRCHVGFVCMSFFFGSFCFFGPAVFCPTFALNFVKMHMRLQSYRVDPRNRKERFYRAMVIIGKCIGAFLVQAADWGRTKNYIMECQEIYRGLKCWYSSGPHPEQVWWTQPMKILRNTLRDPLFAPPPGRGCQNEENCLEVRSEKCMRILWASDPVN